MKSWGQTPPLDTYCILHSANTQLVAGRGTAAVDGKHPAHGRRYLTGMPDLVIYNIVIPCTDDETGLVHPIEKFDEWVTDTAEWFGGISVLGVGLKGIWYDSKTVGGAVEDFNNWYKVGVAPARSGELREHVRLTADLFGQRCIYLERAGEAEFVWHREHGGCKL